MDDVVVKPLASPVREAGVSSVVFTMGGLLVAVVLSASGATEQTVARFFFAAAGWAVLMGAVAVGPYLSRVVRDPGVPPVVELERPVGTVLRTTLVDVVTVAGAALWGVICGAPWLAGFALGNGIVMLMAAWRLRRWERRHGRLLLHAARAFRSRNDRFFAIEALDPSADAAADPPVTAS